MIAAGDGLRPGSIAGACVGDLSVRAASPVLAPLVLNVCLHLSSSTYSSRDKLPHQQAPGSRLSQQLDGMDKLHI